MATVDELRSTAESYGARLITSPRPGGPSGLTDLTWAWFKAPKPRDTVVVVAGGDSDDPGVNLAAALKTARHINDSPATPENVTAVAFPSSITREPDIQGEFQRFLQALTERLSDLDEGGYEHFQNFPFDLVVAPLNLDNPLAHVKGCEYEFGEHWRIPQVKAVILPNLNANDAYFSGRLSNRVGLVNANNPDWPSDPGVWHTVAREIAAANGLRRLEGDARSASHDAVQRMVDAGNVLLQPGIPESTIVVGAYDRGPHRLPTHATLVTRPTNGFTILTDPSHREEVVALSAAGKGAVVFDTSHPSRTLVNDLMSRLTEVTGKDVSEAERPRPRVGLRLGAGSRTSPRTDISRRNPKASR